MSEVAFGRTPVGQLLYDLGFTDLSDRYLAQKHHIPVASIRRMRAAPEMKGLRKRVTADRRAKK